MGIFFHFSELSDEAKAFVEPGCTVNFHMQENTWSADKKMMATQLEVLSAPQENAFKNLEGVCKSDMKSRGFTFIECNETTYLFNITNLVNDDASRAAGNTAKTGHRVIFDAEYSHKYNPPKPYATNVRIVPGQDSLECAPCAEGGMWQRGSRLDLVDDEQEDESRASISPSGRPSANLRSSVSNRASALKANGPARRWSRTTDTTGAAKSDKPSGGLRILDKTCKFSRKCTRADCWFEHPKGRQIVDGLSMSDDDDSDSGSDDAAKVSSMGKASLRLLVNALVGESGRTGYLTIRNALQKSEYVGRELTRDEKNSVGEILEELDTTQGTTSKKPTTTTAPKKSWRDSSSSRLSSRSIGGARVSLSDMCRDPSLHSRISMSNQPEKLTDRPAIDVVGLFA